MFTSDRVIRYDTVRTVVPGVRVDTVVSEHRFFSDSLVIERERLRVVTRFDTVMREVVISGECLPDTIYQTVPVEVVRPQVDVRSTWDRLREWVVIGALVVFAAMLIRYLRRRDSADQ